MADLVDYLRDKLDHTDDVACTCARVDVGCWDEPPKTVRGRLNPGCPIHALKIVHPGMIGYIRGTQIVLFGDRWRCLECGGIGVAEAGEAGYADAWDHLDLHDRWRR